MKNRIVAFLLTLAICVGLLTVVAFGEDAAWAGTIIVEKTAPYNVYLDGEPLEAGTTIKLNVDKANGRPEVKYGTLDLSADGTHIIEDKYQTLLGNFDTAKASEGEGVRELYGQTGAGATVQKYKLILQDRCEHDNAIESAGADGHRETCKICGLESDIKSHELEYTNEGKDGHSVKCKTDGCDYATEQLEAHTNPDEGYCTKCDYAEKVTLTFDIDGKTETKESTCGQKVVTPEDPTKEGHSFDGWFDGDTKLDVNANATLDMDGKTYTAKFTKTAADEFTVKVEVKGGHGTAEADVSKAKAGDAVTITTKPDTGYEVDTITTDDSGTTVANGKFTMPAKNIVVTVTFKESVKPDDKPSGSGGGSSKPSIKPGTTTTPTDPVPNPGDQTGTGTVAGFSDVSASAWYADAVKYVVDRGLFGGVGNGRFAPDANMTRAMMWTVLARYKGVDTNTGSNWYEAARTWAMQQNISDGTMADGNVTREQFVTMLWRLSGEPAATNSASFTDNGRVSSYAQNAVNWAVAQGIVNGYNDGSFRPQGSATRAEVAKMLMVFCVTSEG